MSTCVDAPDEATARNRPPGGVRIGRESILNTVLFAEFPGYMTKLWMVDPVTNDYAGLYSWRGRRNAERYATYITTLLGPLSTPGSVGHRLIELNGPAR